MTMRIKPAFASMAVAALITLGASSHASALDLLDELIGGTKYADAGCGCSQKSSGHVQRCGSDCGGKGLKGHTQRTGGKGFAGHVQRVVSKGGSCGGHAQRNICKGGHVQHASKAGKKGGSKAANLHAELCAKIRAKMASMKPMLYSHHAKCACDHGKGKGFGFGTTFGGYSESMSVPQPVIQEGYQSVPVPPNPDHST